MALSQRTSHLIGALRVDSSLHILCKVGSIMIRSKSLRVRSTPLLSLLLLVCAAPLFAQFEGVVESRNLTTDDEGKPVKFTITMWIKNDRMRVETGPIGATPPSTMIYRADKKIVWMLNDEERSYFEILQSPTDIAGDVSPNAQATDDSLVQTRKKKKILGYPCELYIVRDGDQVTEIWGTRALAGLLATTNRVLGEESTKDAPAWTEEFRRLGMFTLSARTMISGKIVESQDVSKIQPQSVDEGKFELPEGYKKQVIGGN